ncbi:hypothetical protein [Sphingomonas immobilis]|uniref:Uncharacterized protein n=1 Tax=Sphingomonas immobilis TaxID=3063997 RepID=A0ABT9A3T4_9SPHN|nr:hypothetical protein [Sphingomonas sp. CA1-15]MDO7844501.1 hypothetical protein [Sphingomonas sp. CA1-15]
MYRLILPAMLLVASSAALSSDKGYEAREAAANKVRLDDALAGLVPGKPQQCVETRFTEGTQRIGDTILYGSSRRMLYRVDTSGGCRLDDDDIIVTKVFGSQLCGGDLIQTVSRVGRFQTGSCTFREVIPYRRAPKP